MKSRKNIIYALGLVLPFVLLLGWVIDLSMQKDMGREVKVSISGYDPRDLLSGHYIRYQIDWENTDCSQFDNNICPEEEFCGTRNLACRFYVPEADAEDLDRILRNSDIFYSEIVYSYSPGKEPIAKELLVEDMPWREYLKEYNSRINYAEEQERLWLEHQEEFHAAEELVEKEFHATEPEESSSQSEN